MKINIIQQIEKLLEENKRLKRRCEYLESVVRYNKPMDLFEPNPDVEKNIIEMCKLLGVGPDIVKSGLRARPFIVYRQVIKYKLCLSDKYILREIAQSFHCKHDNIIHSRDKVQDMLDTRDSLYVKAWNKIKDYEI